MNIPVIIQQKVGLGGGMYCLKKKNKTHAKCLLTLKLFTLKKETGLKNNKINYSITINQAIHNKY